MRQLAQMQHAWLSDLAVVCQSAVDADAVTSFISAAPHLRSLDVGGNDVFAAFPHPGITRLRVTGGNALPALFDSAAPLANVQSLDLALQPPRTDGYWQPPWTGSLQRIALPALRELDLSRLEPVVANPYGYAEDYDDPDDAPTGDSPSALVILQSQKAIRSQLVRLVLRSIESHADFDALEAIMAAGMPRLEQVEVKRSHYFHAPDFTNSRVTLIRPAPWPWPPPAEIPEGDAIHVLCPGSRSGDTVPIADAAAVMENKFEDLDADARYAWTRFWVFVAELGELPWKSDPHREWTDERTFPAELMVAALEACAVGGSGGWRELRDELRFRRPLPAGAVITVHRVRSVTT
jgi:hypothetical protein